VKGIDTNVLVRYLVQDEPLQGQKSSHVHHQGVFSGLAGPG
jgi:predicted nucleic-acid-binding protein